MTASDPTNAHPAPPNEAVLDDRLLRVPRARRLEPAARREPEEDGTVEPDEPDPDGSHAVVGPPRTPPRRRSRPTTSTISSWLAFTMVGRAMIMTSQPGWNVGAIALSTSRSRRRTRLRTTAPPSRLPVDKPIRVVSRSVRRKRATRSGWDRTAPSPWSARKSFGLESITSRGAVAPRSLVRPSAACDRGRGVRRRCVGRRWSSSGRGSRAPWRDAAFWAERSASSGVRAILSIRPRGLSISTPRGTQTRQALTSAGRVDVRAIMEPTVGGVKHRRPAWPRPRGAEGGRAGACRGEVWGERIRRGAACSGNVEVVRRGARTRSTEPAILPGSIARFRPKCLAGRDGAVLSFPSARHRDGRRKPLEALQRGPRTGRSRSHRAPNEPSPTVSPSPNPGGRYPSTIHPRAIGSRERYGREASLARCSR
jgi:hypothetical protein